ncbi:DUF4145 domain-containing protein [Pseudomonas oryzihabitans]|uniref:DUF4145 domain-containing protein n=1 Tax=Pseudomonas oryzihabitans TaxID=47885 RepID=UPI003CFB30F6
MANYSWLCPFCKATSIVTYANYFDFSTSFDHGNKHGAQAIKGSVIICPNENCKEYSFKLAIGDLDEHSLQAKISGKPRHNWALVPDSMAKLYPAYIPTPLIQDYTEACLIVKKSPKASATLSRRCLQGMIRDFWKIQGKKSLYEEIEGIKEKIEGITWDAIDSLRKVGNIGAHMEKDINLIVEVDEDEAALLIELIETLFEEWYIQRHQREERMAKIKAIAAMKEATRKTPPQNDAI